MARRRPRITLVRRFAARLENHGVCDGCLMPIRRWQAPVKVAGRIYHSHCARFIR